MKRLSGSPATRRWSRSRTPPQAAATDGAWEAPELPAAPVAQLLEENVRRGACPDGWAASAQWERACDVPLPVLARFAEAADGVSPP